MKYYFLVLFFIIFSDLNANEFSLSNKLDKLEDNISSYYFIINKIKEKINSGTLTDKDRKGFARDLGDFKLLLTGKEKEKNSENTSGKEKIKIIEKKSKNIFYFENSWTKRKLKVEGNYYWNIISKNNGDFNICKRNKSNICLYHSDGILYLKKIKDGLISAQWRFEKASNGYVKIRTKGEELKYINIEEGKTLVSLVESDKYSSHWKINRICGFCKK